MFIYESLQRVSGRFGRCVGVWDGDHVRREPFKLYLMHLASGRRAGFYSHTNSYFLNQNSCVQSLWQFVSRRCSWISP